MTTMDRPGSWEKTLGGRLWIDISLSLLLVVVLLGTARAVSAQSAAEDSLAQALAIEMASTPRSDAEATSGRSTPARSTSVRSAATTNPDISFIGDARTSIDPDAARTVDGELHEVEASFRSAIDPFARADIYISMHNEDGDFEFELEEAYLTTLALPFRLQARIGKFRSNVGKINRLHPHALPFIDTPLVYQHFFGGDGLNDQGLSVSWLVPNDAFYQELSVEVTRGPSESESFALNDGGRLLYSSHLRSFWDLSRNATIDLGLTAIIGANDADAVTRMGGVDLTYIWKPLQFNTYRQLTLQGETFFSRRETAGDAIKQLGFLCPGGLEADTTLGAHRAV